MCVNPMMAATHDEGCKLRRRCLGSMSKLREQVKRHSTPLERRLTLRYPVARTVCVVASAPDVIGFSVQISQSPMMIDTICADLVQLLFDTTPGLVGDRVEIGRASCRVRVCQYV